MPRTILAQILLHYALVCVCTATLYSQQYWLPGFVGYGSDGASGYYRLVYWQGLELLPLDGETATSSEAERQLKTSSASASWLSNRCRSVGKDANEKADSVQLLTEGHLQKAASLLFWPQAAASPNRNSLVTIVPTLLSLGNGSHSKWLPNVVLNPGSSSASAASASSGLAFLHVSAGRIGVRFTSIGRVSLTVCTEMLAGALSPNAEESLLMAGSDSSASLLSAVMLLAPAVSALTLAAAAGFVCCTWRRTVRPGLDAAAAAAASAATAVSAATAATAASASVCSAECTWRHHTPNCQVSFVVPPPVSFRQQQQQQQQSCCQPRARSTPYPAGQQKQQYQMQTLQKSDSCSRSNSRRSPLLLQLQSTEASASQSVKDQAEKI